MKPIIILLLLLHTCTHIYSQKPVVMEYSDKGLAFESRKPKLKMDSTYILRIKKVNPAHVKVKIEAKSFEIHTPTPTVLTPLLQVPGSLQLGSLGRGESSPHPFNRDYSGSDPIKMYRQELEISIDKLAEIKRISDNLYISTKEAPDSSLAAEALKKATRLYESHVPGSPRTKKPLLESVGLDISKVLYSHAYLDAYIKQLRTFNSEIADLYAFSLYWNSFLTKTNFLEYPAYIQTSTSYKAGEVSSKPFKAEKDLTELRIILVDTYKKDTLYNAKNTLHHYNSIGLSFSTGFFYTNGLSDQLFYIEEPENGIRRVRTEDEQKFDISIGAFGHLYYRASPSLRAGPGLGLSVSPFDGKTRYMIGGGILVGTEKMIALTAGLAWGKVKQLSAKVSKDDSGYFLANDVEEVPVFDKIKRSFYIGLTYNLASTRQ